MDIRTQYCVRIMSEELFLCSCAGCHFFPYNFCFLQNGLAGADVKAFQTKDKEVSLKTLQTICLFHLFVVILCPNLFCRE